MTLLSDAELDRYARHIVLPQIGGAGQARLKAAHVAVIGAGGIGCPVIQYLAAAGVGALTIIDDDRVELSNLQRQILFADTDIGAPKAEAAAKAAQRINPHGQYHARTQRIDAGNAAALLAGATLVVDGCDNFATRLAVNAACVTAQIPLLSAAIEAVRVLAGFGEALTGKLILTDMLERRWREVRIAKDPECPICRQ